LVCGNPNRDNIIEILLAKTIYDGPNRMCFAHLANPTINVNLRKYDGKTALNLTCLNSYEDRNIEMILSHPTFDVNLKDDRGKTILHRSCKSNDTKTVLKILQYLNMVTKTD